MPITRIARTHLVYQFIILTLVILGVGYYELLLERRFVMFLLVLPTFLYQLIILSCCTELIPMPRWINFSDVDEREQNTESSQSTVRDNNPVEKPVVSSEQNLSILNRDLKVSTRKYKLRNWKACSNVENSELQSPTIRGSDMPFEKNEDISLSCNDTDKIQNAAPTKSYFFPYRQKRLEQWIETKENARPHKIRNWKTSVNDEAQQDSMPARITTDEVTSGKISDDTSSSISDFTVNQESELNKRYTFPFRQKRDQWMEADNEIEDSDVLPSTPYWHSVGYSVAVKQEARRRRRSVSSSLLSSRQNDARKYESDRCKDFSQSVEISCVTDDFVQEKATSSPTTTFGKMKLGIVNCFSKIKKENNKTNSDKESKRRSFKSIFQSRENINAELKNKHRSYSKPNINDSASVFYPKYIPYPKDRFESDVCKRMMELPKMQV